MLLWLTIIFIIHVVWTVLYQKMYYDRYYYDWSQDTMTIKKGVIDIQQIFLPFEEIQNVFLNQDLLDRIFGIYDIHVSTAGRASVILCHIDGLSRENADKLLPILLAQVKKNRQA
jgi:putative membrane protein